MNSQRQPIEWPRNSRVIFTSLQANAIWFAAFLSVAMLYAGICRGEDRLDIASDAELQRRCKEEVSKASIAFARHASTKGGFVYQVSLDGTIRLGEGKATPTEVWVQPPGTPTVGMAFLRGYQVTGNKDLLKLATEAADALIYGQLQSGGWTDRVDFDPKGKSVGPYRNGNGNAKGRNYSTLDDDKSQSAIRFLIELDLAYSKENREIHDSAMFALNSLLTAQFASGGFPQGWNKPVENHPIVKASFPENDWRKAERIKAYWDYPTLNDGLAGTVTSTLFAAYEAYQEERFKDAILKFGDFLILAQLPEPQPGWAQQYTHELVPMWARKFEPPSVVGRESEDVLETLICIAEKTGEKRFLKPIPNAIAWIRRSQLEDGQLARFYELKTNKPLYFVADEYTVTYSDSNLPTHYGFKTKCGIEKIEVAYQKVLNGETTKKKTSSMKSQRKEVIRVLKFLDQDGLWVTDKDGHPVSASDVGLRSRDRSKMFLDSLVFSSNLSRLLDYIEAYR